jgi:hypothetical protein
VFLKVGDDGDDDKIMIAENIDDEPACRDVSFMDANMFFNGWIVGGVDKNGSLYKAEKEVDSTKRFFSV